jgi:hypothetical protein
VGALYEERTSSVSDVGLAHNTGSDLTRAQCIEVPDVANKLDKPPYDASILWVHARYD